MNTLSSLLSAIFVLTFMHSVVAVEKHQSDKVIKTKDGLVMVYQEKSLAAYRSPAAGFSHFKRLMIKPVSMSYRSRSEELTAKQVRSITKSYTAQIKSHLATRFPRVSNLPGPDVIELRCHLLDIKLQSHSGFAPNMSIAGGRSSVAGSGRSAIDQSALHAIYVLELIDTSNNKPLIRIANNKQLRSSEGNRFAFSKVYDPMFELIAGFIAE